MHDKVKQVARLILNEVRSTTYDCESSPDLSSMKNGGKDLIPELLQRFLFELVRKGKKGQPDVWQRKCCAFTNCIILAIRLRSFLCPSLLGLTTHTSSTNPHDTCSTATQRKRLLTGVEDN